jgi:hypothetical protein
VLFSLGGGLALLALGTLAAGWYALGEERRTGRLLSRVLSRQFGVAIQVERAVAEPARLTLRGVRIPPGEHWGGAVEIRELRVEGGLLPVVFPRGRAMSVVAVSTSVTLAPGVSLPASDTFGAVRSGVLRLLEWPAVLALEIKGGELRSGRDVLAFDLSGEKSGDGKVVLRLNLREAEGRPALTVEAMGAAAAQDVRVTLRAEGDPRRLGGFWPTTRWVPARVAAEANLVLSDRPELEVIGRVAATPAVGEGAVPITAEFAARYQPRSQRVELSRLVVEQGPALRLELAGTAEEVDRAPRLTFRVRGTVDGSRLTGDGTYGVDAGELRAKLELEQVAAGPLMRRFGYALPGLELNARSARLTVSGRAERKDRARLEGALALSGVEAPSWLTGPSLELVLRLAGTLGKTEAAFALVELSRGELVLSSPKGPIAHATARSQPRDGARGGPWPLGLEARLPDLSRLPSPEALPLTLGGEASLRGSLDWEASGPRFSGRLGARVAKGEVDVGGPLLVSHLLVSLPIVLGGPAEAPAGNVAAESISAYGFVLRRLGSPAQLKGSALSLPEIAYSHYGGSGRGYARLDLGGAVPLTLRLEGEGVDLATLTTEYGLTLGRITGKVRYLLVLQYSQAHGVVAGGQVTSEPPGGEVNIDALKKLLSYAEADPTGIVKQTLEHLSVFSYESLAGDVRVGPQGARVSLSLEGKKRFGIFPGPVKAINFRGIPLSLLVKTFGQPRRDSP